MKVIDLIKSSQNSKIGQGIKWNLFSLVFLAASGLVFQVLIMGLYSTEVMGYFNVAFALYVAFSQLAVAGIHFSVLKYISEFSDDKEKCNEIMTSSLVLVTVISIVISGLLFIITGILSQYSNDLTITAFKYAIPAFTFFSINKVMLNYYNGKSHMKEYAVFQSLRNIFLMLAFIFIAVSKMSGVYLTLCFVLSEGVLFFVITAYTLYKKYLKARWDKWWFKEHLRYGMHIMPSNMVLELNYRIDIISLKLLAVSNSIIGIYSFAVVFAEGFYQILIVIRRNINPSITQHYVKNEFNLLDELRIKVRKYTRMIIPALSVVLVLGYVAICYIMKRESYLEAVIPLCILLASMSINSYHTSFGNMLNQIGKPKHESLLNIITLSCNFLFNIILIPLYGIYGAAIATALSYFVFSGTLYYFVKRQGGYKLKVFN